MLEDAAREFRRVLELDPREQLAAFHLAVITLREGRFRDALREFMSIVERFGPHYPSFVNVAVALRSLGHHDDALLALDEAEKLRPGAADVALARAIAHVETRALAAAEGAFADYRERLGAGRKPPPVYFHSAGLAAALAGATARALEIVTAGREAHAHSPPLLLLAGLLNERRGDLEAARQLYRRVVELDPSLVQAQKNLGDIAYAQGSDEEALRLFQRASELDPELGDDLYTKLGNLHYRSRNREGAVRYWTRALDLNPDNGVVRNNLEIVAHAAV
jgi:tetratricopeptide (TPR) repeat protein